MPTINNNTDKLLFASLVTAFLLTLTIIELSSFLRLEDAGIGCQNWPACYAVVKQKTEQRSALTPQQSLNKIHRLIATLLVLAAGLIAYRVFRQPTAPQVRKLTVLMGVLLIILSIIGPYTPEKQYPLIGLANILCGLLLLITIASIGWQICPSSKPRASYSLLLKQWAKRCWYLGIIVIGLGAWSSANYAPLASTVENTDASASLLHAYNPVRKLALDSHNRVIADKTLTLIRNGHLATSLLLAIIIVQLAVVLIWKHPSIRLISITMLLLITAECMLGWLSLDTKTNLYTLLSHHALAGLLLLNLSILNIQLKPINDNI